MVGRRKSTFTQADIRELVEKALPAWVKACAADAETIVVKEESFGASIDEFILLGCAVKYAASKKKAVHLYVADASATQVKDRRMKVAAVYRDTPQRKRRKARVASGDGDRSSQRERRA